MGVVSGHEGTCLNSDSFTPAEVFSASLHHVQDSWRGMLLFENMAELPILFQIQSVCMSDLGVRV